MLKKRSIPLALIFSVITCGIYGIYWFVCITNDTNALAKTKTAGGGMAIVWSILTLGIYQFYWAYMTGKKAGQIEKDSSNGVVYLILFIFGLGFVDYILAQKTLNTAAELTEKPAA